MKPLYSFEELKADIPELKTADDFIKEHNVKYSAGDFISNWYEDRVLRALNEKELEELRRNGSQNHTFHSGTRYSQTVTFVLREYVFDNGTGVVIFGPKKEGHFDQPEGEFLQCTREFRAPVDVYHFNSIGRDLDYWK